MLVSFGLVIAYFFLAPGFWGPDALNGYIQGVTGKYGSSQPVFLAFVCSITAHIYPGALPIFMGCMIFYFSGFAIAVFENILDLKAAVLLFFILSFYPLLFATMGVIQTETFQLAVLALFIPCTQLLYRYKGKYRKPAFVFLSVLLSIFWLVRHDSVPVAIILAYWLSYSLLRKNDFKAVLITFGLLISFYVSGYVLDKALDSNRDSGMGNALLIADIAAISGETNINYVPDYCWQPYLSKQERSVEKIKYGMREWKYAFFSYLFNIDPSVGLFTYNTNEHTVDLAKRWLQVVLSHPILYINSQLSETFKAE